MTEVGSQRLRWPEHRWAWLTAVGVVVAFLGGIVWPDWFRLVGVNAISPIFSDLIAILAAGEADQAGRDVFAHNPLDPFNRPHVYGPWWLVVGDLGWVRADARWLGPLLAGGFIATVVTLLRPSSWRRALFATALLISPPVLLAMERGNNDLVIFLILAGASWAIGRSSWAMACVAGAGVVLASALKFYPLVTLPLLAAKATSRLRVCGLMLGTVLLATVVFGSAWRVYLQVLDMAPEPLTVFGYGAKLTYYVMLTLPEQRAWLLMGGLPVLALAGWLGWRWRVGFWSLVPTTGSLTACYLAGAICWVACYTVTISFPYRMVLLLLPAALWLRDNGVGERKLAMRFQAGVAAVLMWTPGVKEHLLVLSVDESTFTGSWFAWFALGVEHALALIISLALSVSLLGWLCRRGQAGAVSVAKES